MRINKKSATRKERTDERCALIDALDVRDGLALRHEILATVVRQWGLMVLVLEKLMERLGYVCRAIACTSGADRHFVAVLREHHPLRSTILAYGVGGEVRGGDVVHEGQHTCGEEANSDAHEHYEECQCQAVMIPHDLQVPRDGIPDMVLLGCDVRHVHLLSSVGGER